MGYKHTEFKKINNIMMQIAGTSINTRADLANLLDLLDLRDIELMRLAKKFNLNYKHTER